MRVLRWLLGSVSAFVGLLLVAVLALWLWAGTEGSARWALEEVARRQPLAAEGVTGTLRTGLRAARLAWSQDGLEAEARDVQLAWRPLALLQRTLQLDRLQAASIQVSDRRPDTGEPLRPPASLALPLRVRVDDLQVGRFAWDGAAAVELRDLSAEYGYDGASHRLALRNLRMVDGHYRGQARVDAREPFELEASLRGRIVAPQLPGAPLRVPLVFDAHAAGTLVGLEVRANVQGEPGSAGPSATRATATARIAPFEAQPLVAAQARFERLDIGALWPQAPLTLLSGSVALQPQGTATWTVSADLRNGLPGPWDRKRLPAEQLRVEGDLRLPAAALVRELEARVAGGRIVASGTWEGEDAWKLAGTLTGINPAAVHSAMAPLPLSGRASARARAGGIDFDTELAAAGAMRARPPAAELTELVGALELRSLRARGRWAGEALALPQLVVRTADATLDAAVDLRLASHLGSGRAELQAPGLRVRAIGSVGARTGGGSARANVDDLAQAQAWLRKLPGMPEAVGAQPVAGRAELQLAWQGGWLDPSVQATATLPVLRVGEGEGSWSLADTTVRADGRLAEARLDVKGTGRLGERQATVEASGRGGRLPDGAWQGQLAALDLALRDAALGPGPWRAVVRTPVDLRWQDGQLDAGAGSATLTAPTAPPSQARLLWEPVRWRGQELRSAGRLEGLPLAWAELAGVPSLAGAGVQGDLVFDAAWDVQVAQALRLRASLARRSGDVSLLAETAEGTRTRIPAGVREARATLESDGEAVTLALRWASERAGTAEGRVATQLSRAGDGWAWPEEAPLSGNVRAQLPRIAAWSMLAPPGWRLRGSLAANVTVGGTRSDPVLGGTVAADGLALRSVVDGVSLRDGRLRARLDGRRLVLEEFSMRGAGQDGGQVTGAGEGTWTQGGPQVRVNARLDRLRASNRADRELTVSGNLLARMDASAAELRGDLRVDRARITLPEESAPRLGDDVVVRNLPPGVALGARAEPASSADRGRPVHLAVALDFGNDFRVQGRGIQTRLAGRLQVAGESVTAPRLEGVVRTVGGEYRAYNQRLEIERGVLRFTGPADNPALDVLAIRPRLAQRVGVQVTGRAQAPFVRLYAEPDLPDPEKLSWLVLGRASASGGAETALLQQAAMALLASRTGGGTGASPAALLGLDELGLRRDGEDGPAVTLGKRLGRDLYATYERSLAGAVGTLNLFYDLSRRVTVRAQAGERAAVDLIVTFTFD